MDGPLEVFAFDIREILIEESMYIKIMISFSGYIKNFFLDLRMIFHKAQSSLVCSFTVV